jgi:hypothetical protein
MCPRVEVAGGLIHSHINLHFKLIQKQINLCCLHASTTKGFASDHSMSVPLLATLARDVLSKLLSLLWVFVVSRNLKMQICIFHPGGGLFNKFVVC